ncbi:MAG: cytochrome bc complex cytochrome b subunit [Cytophagales bacterium]|nr:cytochrome bc complex cytochrome b subunit [Cytophagales bacterium]
MTDHKVRQAKARRRKLNNLILHLHPNMVPEKALKFTLTWGLGGMAALLFVLLVFTGILLRFVYVPTPEGAYDSIVYLKQKVVFGNFVRNIHYWSATFFIVVVFLHLMRVLYTGAYAKNRASNWVIGLCLLLLAISMNFTGYLLPWDQLAYWAITVSANMLKYIPFLGESLHRLLVQGDEIGAPSLLAFYNLHTGLLPLATVMLLAFHFWKIRKARGVVIPKDNPGDGSRKVPVWPNLLVREFVVALILLAVVLIISFSFDAPLQERANPSVSPNPAKAPWYFMGFQELILHFHPTISVLILPLGVLILLFSLPYIKNIDPEQGIWFLSKKGRKISICSALSGKLFAVIFVLLNEYLIKSSSQTILLKNGTIPFIVFMAALYTHVLILDKKFNATIAEILQSVLTIIFSSFLVLTMIGIFFRGKGMALIF